MALMICARGPIATANFFEGAAVPSPKGRSIKILNIFAVFGMPTKNEKNDFLKKISRNDVLIDDLSFS